MSSVSEVLQETFSFTLVYSGVYDITQTISDGLFEAGCDDALLGMINGELILDFGRKAPSFREALLSAIEGVEGAALPIKLVRVEPIEPL